MLEEKKDNLPEAEGNNESETENTQSKVSEIQNEEIEVVDNPSQTIDTTDVESSDTENPVKVDVPKTEENQEDSIEEIDKSNAEDAEDKSNEDRHVIPVLDYHSMSLEELSSELKKLVQNEKLQAIKTHVDGIKSEFDLKYQMLVEQKKEDFISNGGNEIDFKYSIPVKSDFTNIFNEYREKRNQYYKNLEQTLKVNLENRLEIIEELKGLINVEENINTTYRHFKELQDKWRNAGPIPRTNYNNVWKTYHHHIEIFYDFLDLNRDLRDLDFKHNLQEKEKLITKAIALGEENDIGKSFRELQTLHKIWKEEIGPVDKEHREDVWNRFSQATKIIHDKRQEYFKNIDSIHEQNLVIKNEIIAKITTIANQTVNSHSSWQKQIKQIDELRDLFFKAGKVPSKLNEPTWASFKQAVRTFNQNKNNYYKQLKKEQQLNYEKKIELVKLAESLKDSTDWAKTTPILKKVQDDWKKIGHVPRKFSDKIWNDFKTVCNHYFDQLHAHKNEENKEELVAFEAKKTFLDTLKDFELSGDKEKDLASIKEKIAEWKSLGRVPYNKKSIEGKFNKILDALFKKMDMNKQETELIKYGNKLEQLAGVKDGRLIENERVFIKRKMDELKASIRQLENNLQFFSSASGDNPLVKDVIKNIEIHKSDLTIWEEKLKKIKSLNK